MSQVSSLLITDWNGVRQCLAQLAESHDQVADFLGGLFQQLEELWGQMLRHQRRWQAEHEQACKELEARAAELQQQQQGLEAERQRLHAELERALAEQHQRLAEAQAAETRQREALENELELVRMRAAELAESLAEQSRQIAQERAQWSDELKRMRRLLETLVRSQHAPVTGGDEESAIAEPGSAPSRAAKEDPVLCSVMAQFQMLQKDLARRRRNGTSG